ncbi:hypothetical protein K439DRAFT_1268377, partial [Ramaria rubella]
LDECEKSHYAVCNRRDNDTKGLYALKGLMAMVCHHGIPLFFCDIMTPSKQQFYTIALICQLTALLPLTATMGILYDIACMLDWLIVKVSML